MSMRTAKLQVSLQELSILRIEHPQANPLKLACTLRPGETLPSGLIITAEIHTSRNVPAETTPLAASSVTVAADATSFEVIFDSDQTNQTVTPDSVRALWLVMYGVGDNVHTLAAADLLLGWHAISQVTAPPPAVTLFVEKGGVAWASGRTYASGTMVTVGTTAYVASSAHTSGSTTQPGTGASWNTVWAVLIGDGGGGATNLSATAFPTNVVIESSTGDAATIPAADGTNAGLMLPAEKTKLSGVASGATANSSDATLLNRANHTGTQAISTIVNLQTALDGKASSSHTHSIADVTELQSALDGKVELSSLGDLAFLSSVGASRIDAGAVGELQLGDGAVTAAKIVSIPSSKISDSTTAGRGLLTAADAAAQRTALGLAGSIPAGAGTELQYRDSGALAALSGSSVSGSALTVAELRVNAGDAATGFRATHVSGLTTLAFYGTGTNGFFYAQAASTQVNYRGTAFRIEGPSGADSTALLQIASTNRVIMRARALNNLCLGPADAASPAAQSISVQSATGTNQSAASAVLCLDGAQGTGTGVGGDILFRVAPTGSTGATQNTLLETLRLRAADRATVCAGAVVAGGPVTLATFTVATVPAASLWTRGLIYVSDDVGGPTPAFSDGTNWRRVADRAVVSTP